MLGNNFAPATRLCNWSELVLCETMLFEACIRTSEDPRDFHHGCSESGTDGLIAVRRSKEVSEVMCSASVTEYQSHKDV